MKMANENLGPAERIINTLLAYSDHMVHNRPGVVVRDTASVTGVRWSPAIWKLEEGQKVVYRKDRVGVGKKQKTNLVRVGILSADGKIPNVGRFMDPGLFDEVAVWMYRQVAEVWKLDNEFAARWASYAYNQDHRDLKVVLAAFMLVQSRKGDPVLDNGKIAFHDDDFRDVGEAMVLLDGAKYLDVKLVLRILDLLQLPEIAAINRELGFGNSARNTFLGRFPKVAEKWLRYREENPKILDGLVKKGFRSSVKRLAEVIKYKPTSAKFFKALRWKQAQAKEGHRALAIGETVVAAETWKGLTEEQICERIVKTKPDFKRIIGLLPEETGLTRAVMAAAIEAGSLSNKDLVIYTPTLEELGLLQVPAIQGRWQQAVKAAEDQRSANIASRVKSKEVKETLQEGADAAMQKAVAEVTRGVVVDVLIDISSSMEGAIQKAKEYVAKFMPGFPPDKLHVSVFNTSGREVSIKVNSAAGVENAFRGIAASGGTDYGAGVLSLRKYKPGPDEDLIMIFVGDEDAPQPKEFSRAVRDSGLNPVAFGLVPVMSPQYGRGNCVRVTANNLGIPCFEIDEKTFADPYAIPRTMRAIIAATPVGATAAARPVARVTLVDTILKTDLLKKPAWAIAA
jgi:hypothetical protein